MRKEKISSIGSDKQKAARYIIIGLIIAVIFATLIGISKSLAANATSWAAYQDLINAYNRDTGLYGQSEYLLKAQEIILWTAWMSAQEVYIATLAQIGVNIGLILLFIGFIGFSINDSLDERTRRASLVLAAAAMFVLILTTFFTQISIVAI